MNSILSTFFTSVITFSVTNLDDLLILIVLFSQASKVFRREHIVSGHYLGFSGIVCISLIGFLFSLSIPHDWIRLIGIFPIVIGIIYFFDSNPTTQPDGHNKIAIIKVGNSSSLLFFRQVFSVAIITFANGGDNIGIYIPLFASTTPFNVILMIIIFFILTGIWCSLAIFLVQHDIVANSLTKYGKSIVPFTLVILGVYILFFNS